MERSGEHEAGQKQEVVRYEVSNFALPEKWSLHNLKYWQAGEYLSLGLNAVSFIDGTRIRNCENFADYQAALGVGRPPIAEQQELSANERHFERVMLALRTCWGIFRDDLPLQLWRELHVKAQELASRYPELMAVTAERIALTSRGMNVEHTLVVELTEGLL